MSRRILHLSGAALGLFAAGCVTVAEYGTQIAQQAGVITSSQGQSLARIVGATEKTFHDITPEQEYYIGRSVTATVLAEYRPYDKPAVNRYVNTVGLSLATHSDRPKTYRGYRFLVLDSDEVNAFAAPGGLILVYKGMLRSTQNEDELAAVLAHEIAHVQNQDGLRAIKSVRLNNALTVIAVEAGKGLGNQGLAQLAAAFDGSVADIRNTLMKNGYSRDLEYQADASAVKILKRAGYNPQALVASLTKMQTHLAQDSRGFGQTHPSPQDRIDRLKPLVGTPSVVAAPAARQQRFSVAMAGVR